MKINPFIFISTSSALSVAFRPERRQLVFTPAKNPSGVPTGVFNFATLCRFLTPKATRVFSSDC